MEKNKESESKWRSDALQDILKEVHSLFTMFTGPLQALLDKQPSGELARSRLYTFITDYLTGHNILVVMFTYFIYFHNIWKKINFLWLGSVCYSCFAI